MALGWFSLWTSFHVSHLPCSICIEGLSGMGFHSPEHSYTSVVSRYIFFRIRSTPHTHKMCTSGCRSTTYLSECVLCCSYPKPAFQLCCYWHKASLFLHLFLPILCIAFSIFSSLMNIIAWMKEGRSKQMNGCSSIISVIVINWWMHSSLRF